MPAGRGLWRTRWLWPYGALVCVVMAAMWPLWSSLTRVLADDVLFFAYPLEVLRRDAVARGEFPFWNPYWFSGIPAYPNPEAGFAYPPNWLLVWLPPIPALNWGITLHVVASGLSAAWCAGRLGANREGQFLSGVTWALGGAMVQRLWPGHLNYIQAFAWLPLATGLAARILRPRGTVYLALTVALLLLAGRPDMFVFAAWWLPVWAMVGAWRKGLRPVVRALVFTGAGLCLGLMLAAVQLLPFAAMLSVSNRFAGLSHQSQTLASLPPWHLLTQFSPTMFGAPLATSSYWAGEPFEWHERLFYIGAAPLLAAIVAVGRWRWACWGLAVVAITLAFGNFTPLYSWVQHVVPGYSSFRVPSRHLCLAALALALAAGLGVPQLRGRQVAAAVLSAALVTAVAGLAAAYWLPVFTMWLGGPGAGMVPPGAVMAVHARPALMVAAFLLAFSGGAALLPGSWATRAQLVLAVADLGLVFGPFRANLVDPNAFIGVLAPLQGNERAVVLGNRGAQLANFGPIVKVTQPGGYDTMVGNGYATLLMGASNPDAVEIGLLRPDDPLLPLLGVQAVLEPGQLPTSPKEPPRPPAWVAGCAWPGGALDVRRPEFPRTSCVMLTSATTRDPYVPPRPATVLSRGAGELKVRAEGPGWLVTTQPWYPGWSAVIDGQPGAVEVVDGALVGVRLPDGGHTIHLTYRPAGVGEGAAVSATSALVLAILWLGAGRRTLSGGTAQRGV